MKKVDSKQRLFEVMGRLDKTFKPKETLNEWNFDKKKGEDNEKESEENEETEVKKEGEESNEHEESETPAEEKAEHEVKPKTSIPVNMIAKVGGK